MSTALSDLDQLLCSLEPTLQEGTFVYSVLPPERGLAGLHPVITVLEKEGLTVVLPEAEALEAGLPVLFRAAWITLTVHSDLQAIGLTAAFASALARVGVSCNVVAGAWHDHLFVPLAQASTALGALRDL